jgi:hypothetical protein
VCVTSEICGDSKIYTITRRRPGRQNELPLHAGNPTEVRRDPTPNSIWILDREAMSVRCQHETELKKYRLLHEGERISKFRIDQERERLFHEGRRARVE